MSEQKPLIDPRQREIAAMVLAAVGLPAPMDQVAIAWKEAGSVCPGITAEKVMGTKAEVLERAESLLKQVLDPIRPPTVHAAPPDYAFYRHELASVTDALTDAVFAHLNRPLDEVPTGERTSLRIELEKALISTIRWSR